MDIAGKTIEATAESHPHLWEAVRELSEKARIAMPKIRVVNPEALGFDAPSMILRMMPAAVSNVEGVPHLTFGTMAHEMGGMQSLEAPVGDALKGVIAHEIGHIVNGDLNLLGTASLARRTPLAMAIGAVVAVAFWRHHQKAVAISDSEKHELGHSPTLQGAIAFAEYCGAGLAGLFTGVAGARKMLHHMEFKADAFSKDLLGSGEPLKQALLYFHDLNQAASERLPEGARRVVSVIEGLLHPPLLERIARL